MERTTYLLIYNVFGSTLDGPKYRMIHDKALLKETIFEIINDHGKHIDLNSFKLFRCFQLDDFKVERAITIQIP
jgi:hypothetical protein